MTAADQKFNTTRLWKICRDCAATVHSGMAPTVVGTEAIARMLLGTAAQESSLEWERQRSPQWDGTVGGFSKWQLEAGSVEAGLKQMRANNTLALNATRFLFHDPKATLGWLLRWETRDVLDMMRINDNDYLGVLFARLHYLRVHPAIPCGLDEQAAYWKRFYNSMAGKGTPEQYIASWARLCAPVVGE